MIVNRESGKCRNIQLKLLVVGHLASKLRIKAMYSFDKQHIVFVELHHIAFIHSFALLEVVGRHLHLSAGKQGVEVGIELLKVESI